MLKRESTGMPQADTVPEQIAVKVDSVSKAFIQWQRKEGIRGLHKQ